MSKRSVISLPVPREVDDTPAEGIVPPSRLAHALRNALNPTDRVFDRFLPHELRVVSGLYWTPLAVATRAAGWIDRLGVRTVVDIGSGPGKFCVATALVSQATFIGIEQRVRLVDAARDLAETFGVSDRVSFVHAAFGDIPPPAADAYYLYNPFGENLFGPEHCLDSEVELGDARYARDIAAVERMLTDAPVGTCLITYNGFGGRVPAGYREVLVDRKLPNVLRIWKRTSADRGGRPHSADAQ